MIFLEFCFLFLLVYLSTEISRMKDWVIKNGATLDSWKEMQVSSILLRIRRNKEVIIKEIKPTLLK